MNIFKRFIIKHLIVYISLTGTAFLITMGIVFLEEKNIIPKDSIFMKLNIIIFIIFGIVVILNYLFKVLKMKKIFISYSRNDKIFVDKFYNNLQKKFEQTKRFKFIIDDNIISIGDIISDKIKDIIKHSDMFIVIYSENSLKCESLRFQINNIIKTHKKIIPVKVNLNNRDFKLEQFKDIWCLTIKSIDDNTIEEAIKLICKNISSN